MNLSLRDHNLFYKLHSRIPLQEMLVLFIESFRSYYGILLMVFCPAPQPLLIMGNNYRSLNWFSRRISNEPSTGAPVPPGHRDDKIQINSYPPKVISSIQDKMESFYPRNHPKNHLHLKESYHTNATLLTLAFVIFFSTRSFYTTLPSKHVGILVERGGGPLLEVHCDNLIQDLSGIFHDSLELGEGNLKLSRCFFFRVGNKTTCI